MDVQFDQPIVDPTRNRNSQSVLGLRLSVADAAVVGSVGLLIASFYLCMCVRRESEEVSSVLVELTARPRRVQCRALTSLRGSMVLSTSGEQYAPVETLSGQTAGPRTVPFADLTFRLLVFLPAVTVLLVIASDIYFAFVDISPQRHNFGAAWDTLSFQLKYQLVCMDLFALLVGLIIMAFCRSTWQDLKRTERLLAEFTKQLPSS
jgi:hypothetical protein